MLEKKTNDGVGEWVTEMWKKIATIIGTLPTFFPPKLLERSRLPVRKHFVLLIFHHEEIEFEFSRQKNCEDLLHCKKILLNLKNFAATLFATERPRENEVMAKRNREDGNSAFTI